MSEWITDRGPIEHDESYVYNSFGHVCHWIKIAPGEPWKPIPKSEPYVKPKRWKITTPEDQSYVKGPHAVYFYVGGYVVMVAERIPTIEAAERIAAIYEEVMP